MRTKPFDISLWEERIKEEEEKREERRIKTLEKYERLLRRYFKGKKTKSVFLAGSILQEYKFYPFSDVDVAVEGLGEDYFKTLLEIEGLLERNIDLIELEDIDLRMLLSKEERRLYEKRAFGDTFRLFYWPD